jgi:hypothetical protein
MTATPTSTPFPTPTPTPFPTAAETPTPTSTLFPLLPIYDFYTGSIIGSISCSEVSGYTWNLTLLPDDETFIYSSKVELYGSTYAGFLMQDARMICGW